MGWQQQIKKLQHSGVHHGHHLESFGQLHFETKTGQLKKREKKQKKSFLRKSNKNKGY